MRPEDPIIQTMRRAAASVSEQAYCPYSHFPVGAAVLTESGEIFAGCNVENASYGLTICAERAAIFHAIAHGHAAIRAVVIVTPTDLPTPPCGACRQVINEFGPDATVVSFGSAGDVVAHTLPELLPGAFSPHNLGVQERAGDGRDAEGST
jgi:cytidine deaminase